MPGRSGLNPGSSVNFEGHGAVRGGLARSLCRRDDSVLGDETGQDTVSMLAPLWSAADTSFVFHVHGSNFRSGYSYQSIFACKEAQCRIGNPIRGAELAADCSFGMFKRIASLVPSA